jgi:septum formation inhibitor MinC
VKQRHLTALGLTLAVSVVAMPAFAVEKPKPPKPTAKALLAKLTPMEQYRLDLQAFQAALEARRQAIDEINRTFTVAIRKAQDDFKEARATATTAEAKTAADSARKAAIAAATNARQDALDELPPVPTPPVKPAKPKPTPTPSVTP